MFIQVITNELFLILSREEAATGGNFLSSRIDKIDIVIPKPVTIMLITTLIDSKYLSTKLSFALKYKACTLYRIHRSLASVFPNVAVNEMINAVCITTTAKQPSKTLMFLIT